MVEETQRAGKRGVDLGRDLDLGQRGPPPLDRK